VFLYFWSQVRQVEDHGHAGRTDADLSRQGGARETGSRRQPGRILVSLSQNALNSGRFWDPLGGFFEGLGQGIPKQQPGFSVPSL